jgi:hypothetical protein
LSSSLEFQNSEQCGQRLLGLGSHLQDAAHSRASSRGGFESVHS